METWNAPFLGHEPHGPAFDSLILMALIVQTKPTDNVLCHSPNNIYFSMARVFVVGGSILGPEMLSGTRLGLGSKETIDGQDRRPALLQDFIFCTKGSF